MKKTITLLISLLLLYCCNISSKESVKENIIPPDDSIKIFSSPDLFKLSMKWVNEYNLLYPGLKVKLTSVSDTKTIDKLIEEGSIGFVSKEYSSGTINEKTWKVVVGRDIIVPVFNSENPFADEISQHGISQDAFVQFFGNRDSLKWGTLLRRSQNESVNYYRINNESINEGISGFLKTNQAGTVGIEVKSVNEMISAVQKDPLALGFCKMTDILDYKNQSIVENIKLLPIDRDGNGILNYNEKIYDDANVFSRGVWIGKYPKALFSNIYSVSSGQPKKENEAAFLKWIITDGQQYLFNNGFSDLLITERQSIVDKLYIAKTFPDTARADNSLIKTILLIIGVIIAAGFIIDYAVRYLRRKVPGEVIVNSVSQPVFNENTLKIPKGLYFDKTHTWAFMEQNGVVKVGIDDFLQHITGALTSIKMKDKGELVRKGKPILSIIQNGKQLNLYSPVSGIIKEQNTLLNSNPDLMNSSPYNEGWVYMIEPTNWNRESLLLFNADKQLQYIKNEFTRFKDFLSVALKGDSEKYAGIILQDGGEIRDGVLSNLEPEVWEDFQTNFIDPSRQIWCYEII